MIICIREELMPKSHSEKWLLHWGVASPDKQGRGWEGGWMQAAPGRAGFTCQPDTPGSSTYTILLIPNNPMTLIIFII